MTQRSQIHIETLTQLPRTPFTAYGCNTPKRLQHCIRALEVSFFGLLLIFASISLILPSVVNATEDSPIGVQVQDFQYADENYLRLALERVNALTLDNYGTPLNHAAEHDIPLLQRLLDDNIVQQDDLLELQAMGVALGEVFRQAKYMEWVRYIDKQGASRALRLKHTDYIIFPITLISRRASAGIDVDIAALYQKTIDKLEQSQLPDYGY